jgi:hypothetical protein
MMDIETEATSWALRQAGLGGCPSGWLPVSAGFLRRCLPELKELKRFPASTLLQVPWSLMTRAMAGYFADCRMRKDKQRRSRVTGIALVRRVNALERIANNKRRVAAAIERATNLAKNRHDSWNKRDTNGWRALGRQEAYADALRMAMALGHEDMANLLLDCLNDAAAEAQRRSTLHDEGGTKQRTAQLPGLK